MINKKPRQIKKACEPCDHKNYMKGFYPKHELILKILIFKTYVEIFS